MAGIDLSKMCDDTLISLSCESVRPRLLLHACCAPCASYVIEYLYPFFDLTVFFYNPNIAPEEEFSKRYSELVRFIGTVYGDDVGVICPRYDHDEFLHISRELFDSPEGGERCMKCYELRLEKTAKNAYDGGFPWFCSTLSVSPYKNSSALFCIGTMLSEKYGVRYLPSDFKKKDGYKRSIELSREFGLYRQNFCGCPFSAEEARIRRAGKTADQH